MGWAAHNLRGALVTVIKTRGSSPRPLGAMMAVAETGEMVGSVSGGCVESAVVQEAIKVLAGAPPRRVAYGIGDDWAAEAGLTCGGEVEIYILPWHPNPVWRALHSARLDKLPVVLVLGFGGRFEGKIGLFYRDGNKLGALARYEDILRELVNTTFAQQRTRTSVVLPDGRTAVALIPFFPPQRLVIIGAVHLAVALVRYANELGYETIVIDPRPAFASLERFNHADRLLMAWPQEVLPELHPDAGTSIAIVSHDDKIDVPALQLALNSEARYIGALGSRKTVARRIRRLHEIGFTHEQIQRVHNPIGLDLGGRTPEEIALAAMAEIVAARYGKA